MNPTADQLTAFQANGGFQPSECATLLLSGLFVAMLLWGVWAMRTAYAGWVEHRISQRAFFALITRFVAMYLALTFFFLS
jgi:integrating conjugative element protein (TIGR03758 family)